MARLNESLGAHRAHHRTENGLEVLAENGNARVTVYSEGVIRVQVWKEGEEADEFSYAVVAEPEETEFHLGKSGDGFAVKTGLVRVEIDKNPVRFRFLTATGKLLNADDPAFGVSWLGDRVTAYRWCAARTRG